MMPRNCPKCTFYVFDVSNPRCGWCITHDHESCLVVTEFGHARSKDPETGKLQPRQKPQPYPWRCHCGCEWSLQVMCVECRRTGVNLDKSDRCVDTRKCREAKCKVVRPKVSEREIR